MNVFIPRGLEDPRVPKIVGFDTELMNVDPTRDDSGISASRALLREVEGVPANNGGACEQDSGRVFLPGSGASVYIDLDHLEIAGPECRSAMDYMKCFHGMLGIARQAARQANEDRVSKIRVHANNSDGLGNSWGGHLSVMLSRTAYDWIFKTRLHHQLWLASAQVSSLVLTGAGKVGSENERDPSLYQISQRTDFFECLSSINTTYMRPLVNTRDESLAGSRYARLHCIFHDTALCHTSLVLKAGLMQVFVAMIEAEVIDAGLFFEDPLDAVRVFSTDTTLSATARLMDGRHVTAIEHQRILRESAERLVDTDSRDHVPDLRGLLDLWSRMLDALETRDMDVLTRHLDWAAKLSVIERAAAARSLDFLDAPVKVLDHAWSDLESGIYFALERSSAVDIHADEVEIAHAAKEAPENTRAYPRSRLIRALGGRSGVKLDWHQVVAGSSEGRRAVVRMPDPGAGRAECGDLDGLTEVELLNQLGVVVEPDVWRWNFSPHLAIYPKHK